MKTFALILASEPGESMKSSLSVALHPILGDPALLWVLRALPASLHSAVVFGCSELASFVEKWQSKDALPCGTLVEVNGGLQRLLRQMEQDKVEQVLVVPAETPLLQTSTLESLCTQGNTVRIQGPAAFPVFMLLVSELRALIVSHPERDELLDALHSFAASIPATMDPSSEEELWPLESRQDQALIQGVARDQINDHWMEQGVSLLDPDSTYIGPRVFLAKDVIIEPNVRLEGNTRAGEGTVIGQGSIIKDCSIGEKVEIKPYTIAQEAEIGDLSIVGPFARLREGTLLEGRVHIGNFVETKKTTLRTGAKANHLSYLGDAIVGEGTNIGAGLITCNYDGFNKHRTIIGRNVFVGSDCQLVAPVNIGDDALLGAGSTITEDIPTNALAFTRAPLVVKEGGAERLRNKLRAKLG